MITKGMLMPSHTEVLIKVQSEIDFIFERPSFVVNFDK